MALAAISPRRLGLVAVVLTALVLGACNANMQRDPNENSGEDGERGKAQLLPLNEPVNDRVDYNGGDMTDWKLLQIPAPGEITVTLGCDYTGAGCTANLRADVGTVIDSIESQGQPRVSSSFSLARGNYYLEIFVPASATDYTVQVDYEPN